MMPGKRLLCDHKDDREASRPPQRGTYHQLLCLKEVLSPMCALHLMKYADLHHPGIYLNCLNHVCQLVSPMCDLMKYADIHHPVIYLNYLNQVCQLVSPIIFMPTCITHVCPLSYEVCRLTSPGDIFELLQPCMLTCITHYPYADMHHPCVPLS